MVVLRCGGAGLGGGAIGPCWGSGVRPGEVGRAAAGRWLLCGPRRCVRLRCGRGRLLRGSGGRWCCPDLDLSAVDLDPKGRSRCVAVRLEWCDQLMLAVLAALAVMVLKVGLELLFLGRAGVGDGDGRRFLRRAGGRCSATL